MATAAITGYVRFVRITRGPGLCEIGDAAKYVLDKARKGFYVEFTGQIINVIDGEEVVERTERFLVWVRGFRHIDDSGHNIEMWVLTSLFDTFGEVKITEYDTNTRTGILPLI